MNVCVDTYAHRQGSAHESPRTCVRVRPLIRPPAGRIGPHIGRSSERCPFWARHPRSVRRFFQIPVAPASPLRRLCPSRRRASPSPGNTSPPAPFDPWGVDRRHIIGKWPRYSTRSADCPPPERQVVRRGAMPRPSLDPHNSPPQVRATSRSILSRLLSLRLVRLFSVFEGNFSLLAPRCVAIPHDATHCASSLSFFAFLTRALHAILILNLVSLGGAFPLPFLCSLSARRHT